jgi:hypothetical protein
MKSDPYTNLPVMAPAACDVVVGDGTVVGLGDLVCVASGVDVGESVGVELTVGVGARAALWSASSSAPPSTPRTKSITSATRSFLSPARFTRLLRCVGHFGSRARGFGPRRAATLPAALRSPPPMRGERKFI